MLPESLANVLYKIIQLSDIQSDLYKFLYDQALIELKKLPPEFFSKLLDSDSKSPPPTSEEILNKLLLLSKKSLDDLVNTGPAYQIVAPMPKKEYLVLSGGGEKGVLFAGVIKALHEKKLLAEVKHVAGSSVGAMFAYLLALGFTSDEVSDFVIKFNYRDKKFIDFNTPWHSDDIAAAIDVSEIVGEKFVDPKIKTAKDIVSKTLSGSPRGFISTVFNSAVSGLGILFGFSSGVIRGNTVTQLFNEIAKTRLGKDNPTFADLAVAIDAREKGEILMRSLSILINHQIIELDQYRLTSALIYDQGLATFGTQALTEVEKAQVIEKARQSMHEYIQNNLDGAVVDIKLLQQITTKTVSEQHLTHQQDDAGVHLPGEILAFVRDIDTCFGEKERYELTPNQLVDEVKKVLSHFHKHSKSKPGDYSGEAKEWLRVNSLRAINLGGASVRLARHAVTI